MRIAIIAAMEEEVAILKSRLASIRIETHSGFDFFVGKLAGGDVILLQSGIGKVATASGATLLLNNYSVDLVINTGSAGGLDTALNIGDLVVSSEVFYHDADLTTFGYKLGQMAGCPATFTADPHYRQLALECIRAEKLSAVEGVIGSGDRFINGKQALAQIKTHFPHTIAVEMEAAAIGHVCWMFNVPFVIVRAISDNGDDHSAIDFDEFLPLAAGQSSIIVEALVKRLSQ